MWLDSEPVAVVAVPEQGGVGWSGLGLGLCVVVSDVEVNRLWLPSEYGGVGWVEVGGVIGCVVVSKVELNRLWLPPSLSPASWIDLTR